MQQTNNTRDVYIPQAIKSHAEKMERERMRRKMRTRKMGKIRG